MQRQSLGSPGSKHHSHHAADGGAASNGEKAAFFADASEDSKRLSAAASALAFNGGGDTDEEEKVKQLKPQRSSPTASRKNKKNKPSEKLIHGIPVLTFVCFLILYLSSHDPTKFELDEFGGLKRPEVVTDWRNVSKDNASGLIGFSNGGDTVATRRQRNLREMIQRHAASKSRGAHRKFGDF
uniref:Uncharacterized protein n=1 Tax=Kalanchoe fedtschenkoi TaxID=63787 RepID=A0A7N0U4V5_KALFE